MDWHSDRDLPTLYPWVLQNCIGDGIRLVAERNPYYWKTDPDGRPLPYIDAVVFDIIQDPETILLKVSNGEVDFEARHINSLQNKPVLAGARTDGNFDFSAIKSSQMNNMVILLNFTHQDPVKREIFQNNDRRIGLSYAINRSERLGMWSISGRVGRGDRTPAGVGVLR